MAVLLIILAVLLLIFAYLYWVGDFELFTRTGSGPQKKHAMLLAGLAVLSVIGANFARRRTA